MSNDKLVDHLAADLAPVGPRSPVRDGLVIGGIGLLELVLFLALGAVRPDLPMAMHQPSFWWKGGSIGPVALVSGAAALLSLDPAVSPRPELRRTVAIILACLAAGWGASMPAGPVGSRSRRASTGGTGCRASRRCCWRSPRFSGWACWLDRARPRTSAATPGPPAWPPPDGAHSCSPARPTDDPLHIAVWYGVACALVWLFARLLLPALKRW